MISLSTTVFACLSKACAPPPTGKGGSLPRAHGSAVTMDEVRASAKGGNPIFDKIVFNEADEFRLKGNPSGDAVEIDVAGKMLANQRIVKHLVEDAGFKRWQERTGMDDEGAALIVKMVIDQWASDASPSSAFSLCQHRAAAVVHGLDDSYREARRTASDAQVDRAGEIYAESGDLFEAIVRAEYKATQEWFAQHGIKEVVLHRGMALDHDSKTGDVVSAQMYPLSSWSENASEATYFSKYGEPSKRRIVLSTRVPVSMIQSIPLTGRGCLMEYEFVLIGKPTEALVSFDGSDG